MTTSPNAPLLAYETSGRAFSAALWGPQGLVVEKRVLDGARHGVALAPVTQELLALAKLGVKDLSAVAVSLGPGSWTGLRIGLAAAKAMAWGCGLALVGVPSLEALALTVLRAHPAKTGFVVLTVRHAYAEGLYAALWRETSGPPERLMPECVLKPDALPAAVRQAGGSAPVLLCGDDICLQTLNGLAGTEAWKRLSDADEVAAGALAELAWMRLNEGKGWRGAAEIHAAAPLYLRASDPELKLKRRAAGS